MTAIPKIKLESVERFERDYKLRLPFRFGVITVTEGTQAVIRATIALEDGRTAIGVAAEALGAKWFDKSPAFSDAQNLEQLRQALGLAIELYRARGWSTPFGLYAEAYADQLARGAELGLVPLVASYGPALLDRAILDALGRALGLSFADMIRRNVAGHRRDRPDARSRRLRPAAVPRLACARRRHRRAPHGRAGRSDRRRRPDAGRARRRRPAGDAGGGRPPLRRPLLQAQGRRRHRGRPRPAHAHRRRARPRRRRLSRDARRQRAIRRRRGHRRAVAAHAARRRRWSAWSRPRCSSSSRSSAPRRCRSRSMRWPG